MESHLTVPSKFVLGRQGVDNVTICREFIHTMRYTKARKGMAVIKGDLKKAYDRLQWTFIAQTLEDAGIPSKLSGTIMQLITKGSSRLLWNGDSTDLIRHTRGLRQDDPLSPYLFLLCIERLGHWIRSKVEEGRLRAVKALKEVLHYPLFFADNLIFFTEAKEDQILCIKEGL